MADRKQYIDGLRTLANILEQNPEIGLPTDGHLTPMLMWPDNLFTPQEKESFTNLVRTVRAYTRAPMTKDVNDANMKLETYLGGPEGLRVQLVARRELVCERVVVGTETVTKTVPDPEMVAQVPQVEVTEQVEQVEWRCGPVLDALAAE